MNNNKIRFQCGSKPLLEVDWLNAHWMRIKVNAHQSECALGVNAPNRIRCKSNSFPSASVNGPLEAEARRNAWPGTQTVMYTLLISNQSLHNNPKMTNSNGLGFINDLLSTALSTHLFVRNLAC